MSRPVPAFVLTALLDDDLLALNRATGILRRRNLPLAGLSVGPGARPGTSRLSCIFASDPDSVERLANQLRKMIGVREVLVVPEEACTVHEHLLARVQAGPARLSALLDVLSLYEARVVEEGPGELVVEATGPSPLIGSFLRALEPFEVLDVVRGGAVPLPPKSHALERAAAPVAPVPPRPTAIPA
jgi:acetolactate synthase-1/3 small subunit